MADKQTEALKLALEALKQIDEAMPFPVAKLAQAVIHEALALVNKVDQEESSGTEKPAQQQIPKSITCPFCESEHVPGWLHDYNMDRDAHGERPAIKQDLTPEQPAQQEPVAWMWTHTKIGKVGVYFENPSQFFDLSKTSDYKWNPLYTSPPTLSLAQRIVLPDALTDDSESPEYRTGWNECREVMRGMMK